MLVCACIIGTWRYRSLDKGSRLLYGMFLSALVCECSSLLVAYIPTIKNPIYHLYNLVELTVITSYFVYTVEIKKPRFIVVSFVIYICAEILNTIFLQPLSAVNTNMITLECLLIVPMALYALYRIVINDKIEKMLSYVHFWFWAFFLFYFTSSFFFWQFIVYFYRHDPKYYAISANGHAIVNLLVYTGIFLVFLRYPKLVRNGA